MTTLTLFEVGLLRETKTGKTRQKRRKEKDIEETALTVANTPRLHTKKSSYISQAARRLATLQPTHNQIGQPFVHAQSTATTQRRQSTRVVIVDPRKCLQGVSVSSGQTTDDLLQSKHGPPLNHHQRPAPHPAVTAADDDVADE